MDARSYTIHEIDRMRAGISGRVDYPSLSYRCAAGGGVMTLTTESQAALTAHEERVERQLRTAMMAGVDPSEFPELKTDEK